MTGDGCVAIASDLRFGVQNQTNACDMPKVFKVHDQLFVGLAGLASDMQTLCVHLPSQLQLSHPEGRWRRAHHDPTRPNSALSAAHALSRHAHFKFRHNLYKLREERDMKPSTFAHFVSALLYEKRCVSHLLHASFRLPAHACVCISSFGPWFCEPVIAGLEPDGKPFVTGMDLLGALCVSLCSLYAPAGAPISHVLAPPVRLLRISL